MVINIRNPNSGAVAKTRVTVTPRVRVGVGVGVVGSEFKGGGGGEFKGGGGGEFKDMVKAYGNITVAMIMQLSFIRYSYWFC